MIYVVAAALTAIVLYAVFNLWLLVGENTGRFGGFVIGAGVGMFLALIPAIIVVLAIDETLTPFFVVEGIAGLIGGLIALNSSEFS